MSNLPTTTVFLDTETGGLRSGDRPWEVALIVEDPQKSLQAFVYYIADFNPAEADPKALELGRFYDRHPGWSKDSSWVGKFRANGQHIEEVAGIRLHYRLAAECDAVTYIESSTRGARIVASNPTYDVPRLEAMANRHGTAWTGHYRAICATTYAAGVVGLDPSGSNIAIGEALGVDREGWGAAHGAFPDAMYARDLYHAARARAEAHRALDAAVPS